MLPLAVIDALPHLFNLGLAADQGDFIQYYLINYVTTNITRGMAFGLSEKENIYITIITQRADT